MTIEKVTPQDAAALLEIYAPYVEQTAISFETVAPSVEEFTERIVNISARLPYIKAVEDGKILGYAYAGSFKGRKAYDWSVETTIYVRGECRKSGVGRVLYDALEKSLKGMGILNLNACIAFTRNENDAHLTNDSMHFHEHMGYRLVGEFEKCANKFDTWYNMIWMEKHIGNHEDGVPVPNPDFGNWTL